MPTNGDRIRQADTLAKVMQSILIRHRGEQKKNHGPEAHIVTSITINLICASCYIECDSDMSHWFLFSFWSAVHFSYASSLLAWL